VGGWFESRGVTTNTSITARFTTLAYVSDDRNTADVYLTNLDRRELELASDPARISGQIVHIHMFLTPKPGATPIDSTATNATISHLVLAGDGTDAQIGVYEGAGFVLPTSRPGYSTFKAKVRRASLALLASTPGFPDLIGPSETRIDFVAAKDAAQAELVRRKLRQLIAMTGPVERTESTPFHEQRSEPPAIPPEDAFETPEREPEQDATDTTDPGSPQPPRGTNP